MRSIVMLTFLIISINLAGCSMSGNVVPQQGPSMEQVYDSMEVKRVKEETHATTASTIIPVNTVDNQFHKLPNRELKMYVYPHLAGNDEVPIPGYYTEFNAYTSDHYALPSETTREKL